jgi:hypothetical protein
MRSGVVAAVASAAAITVDMDAIPLMAALFLVGFAAGWWSRRTGWLGGTVVGLPFSFLQIRRWAGPESTDPAFWRIAVPAVVVAAGMAVLGGMTGAWLRGRKFQPY